MKILGAVDILNIQQLFLQLNAVLPSFKRSFALLNLGVVDHAISHDEQDIYRSKSMVSKYPVGKVEQYIQHCSASLGLYPEVGNP